MQIDNLVNHAVIIMLNEMSKKEQLDNVEKRALKYAINILDALSEDMPKEEGLSHWQLR